MEHKKHTNSTKIHICTWTPICIVVFCNRGSVLKFLRDRMCSSLKVFGFLEFMHSKWARRQLPGTVTKWSKFHQITMNMENWSTQNYQTNVFFNVRPFPEICARFAVFVALVSRVAICMAWTQKNERVWSRLAQIALQGPCTMQNWKKKTCDFWIGDLCVWHVLGICDRFSKCGTNCKCTKKKCYERGYR
jgi:hypothetical protein